MNNLTVAEVYQALTDMILKEPSIIDKPLEIPVQSSSLGGTSAIGISAISRGFDWDIGRVFLHTTKPIIEKTKS